MATGGPGEEMRRRIRRDLTMRFGTSLFAALVLAGALANVARAQAPRSTGTYSVYGPYSSRASTGTYSVYGPYSTRYSSAFNPAPTSTSSDSSLRTAGLITQTGKGSGQGDDATRSDAGRAPAAGGGLGASRPRYVRIGVAGNVIQGIVIP
jgi:hypothetical protein